MFLGWLKEVVAEKVFTLYFILQFSVFVSYLKCIIFKRNTVYKDLLMGWKMLMI